MEGSRFKTITETRALLYSPRTMTAQPSSQMISSLVSIHEQSRILEQGDANDASHTMTSPSPLRLTPSFPCFFSPSPFLFSIKSYVRLRIHGIHSARDSFSLLRSTTSKEFHKALCHSLFVSIPLS